MARVAIYTSLFCGYCHRAKQLLTRKGVEYEEIDVLFNPGRHDEMVQRASGRHTVPQIFIDERHVGGCDELYALERSGELDNLLQESAA